MYDENLVLNIVKNSKEIIIALDLDGNVIFWNKAAEDIFGYEGKEVLGKLYPLVKNKFSYELETILNKTRNKEAITFRTQKQDKEGNELDLILNTNPLYKNDLVIGVSIIIQQADILRKVSYLSIDIQPESREPKRTFNVIRDLIILTIAEDKKTINQISTDSGINWRTVEKHLTYLIGKKFVSEIFSSEYVRIFELTTQGKNHVAKLKTENYKDCDKKT
ncbi:PAS domain S-box protein [Candidatus Woesearchaeota archaeon]|nr:PAS domain S-box protein [Candidatus Woesearchaeota archaeon]